MKEASPRAPRRRPIAWARIVLPAPVSPVIAFSPAAKSSSASRISTRLSIRSRRSTTTMVVAAPVGPLRPGRSWPLEPWLGRERLAVAAEEGRLGQRRQQAVPIAEADRDRLVVVDLRERMTVDDHAHRHVGSAVPDLEA